MQCGTEAEIKERRRQTERWVWWGVGGRGDRVRQKWKGEKGRGVTSFISPHLSILCLTSSFLLLRHSPDLKKNRQLNYHGVQIRAHDRALMCFCSGVELRSVSPSDSFSFFFFFFLLHLRGCWMVALPAPLSPQSIKIVSSCP